MRIALIVPGFSADADDWCIPALRHLVRRLVTMDEVWVLALRYPYRADRYRLFGAQVTALGGGRRRRSASVGLWLRGLSALRAAHRRHPFDVLHAFWATESGALAALVGRMLGVPALVSLAGGELVGLRDVGYGDQLTWLGRRQVGLALGLADAVTAGSRHLLAQVPHSAAPRYRAPLGVDLALFQPDDAAPAEDPPRLIHVASLTPVKDQATLLRAAARLRRRGLPFTLEIAGEGPLEPELRALSGRLGLSGVVRFRGALPHDRLPSLYRSGALFVQSSRHEAQGLAVLEAAACGLPLVGTGVGVLPELAPEGGVTVPMGDPAALADALAALLAEPARLRALGRAARRRVEAAFGLERCVARFRELYAALACGKRALGKCSEPRPRGGSMTLQRRKRPRDGG